MKKEKHLVNKIYGNHQLARYIDVYEVTTDGCSSSPMSGYKGTEATLIEQPAWNEKFSSWSLTGATATGNNYIINGDVTAKANYETAKNVTTINCDSTKNSGFIGDTATLSNSPAWNEKFSSYSITGSTLTGSNFSFTGSDITAQANFETAKNVTLQTDGHGSIASTKMSGFIGDTATLSNTPAANYTFDNYTITGATLTGSNFKFTGSNITAKANFKMAAVTYYTDNSVHAIAYPTIFSYPQSYSGTVNTDITQFNYAAFRYNYHIGTDFTARPGAEMSWNIVVGVTRYPHFSAMGVNTIDGIYPYFSGDGHIKFIIDRSAKSISAFKDGSYIRASSYSTDDFSAIRRYELIARLNDVHYPEENIIYFSAVKIGGMTSYADAYNY